LYEIAYEVTSIDDASIKYRYLRLGLALADQLHPLFKKNKMLKNFTRNIRRLHIDRLKKKRKRYWSGAAAQSDRMLGKVLQTPAPCSCWLCKAGKYQRSVAKQKINEIVADQ